MDATLDTGEPSCVRGMHGNALHATLPDGLVRHSIFKTAKQQRSKAWGQFRIARGTSTFKKVLELVPSRRKKYKLDSLPVGTSTQVGFI